MLKFILIEVVYRMHLNPRTEAQCLALHSEDLKKAPLVEPNEVRKLELKQEATARKLW